MRQRAGACAGSALAAVFLAGCTTRAVISAPTSGVPIHTVAIPDDLFTQVDPGPPSLSVPTRSFGEVARVVVRRQGAFLQFDVVPGPPIKENHTYTVEAACSAGSPSDRTSFAVYDAVPGAWGRLEPIYSQPFPCDGQIYRTMHVGLPSGRVRVDVREVPHDAVTAYALVRPE